MLLPLLEDYQLTAVYHLPLWLNSQPQQLTNCRELADDLLRMHPYRFFEVWKHPIFLVPAGSLKCLFSPTSLYTLQFLVNSSFRT
jgi:hypothetical protein